MSAEQRELEARLKRARELASMLSVERLRDATGKISLTVDVEHDEYMALFPLSSWLQIVKEAYSSIVPGSYLFVVDIKSLNIIVAQVTRLKKYTTLPSQEVDARFEGSETLADVLTAPLAINLKPIIVVTTGEKLAGLEALTEEELEETIRNSEKLSLPLPPDPGSPVVIPKPKYLEALLIPEEGAVLGALSTMDMPLGPEPVPLRIPWNVLTKHVLIVGTTGAGKTSFIKNFLYYVYLNYGPGKGRELRVFFALDANQDFVMMNFPGFVRGITKRVEIALKAYGFKETEWQRLPVLIVLPVPASILWESYQKPSKELEDEVRSYVNELAKAINTTYERLGVKPIVDEERIKVSDEFWRDYKILRVTVKLTEEYPHIEKESELSIYVAPRTMVLRSLLDVPSYYPSFTERAIDAFVLARERLEGLKGSYVLDDSMVEWKIIPILSKTGAPSKTLEHLKYQLRTLASMDTIIISNEPKGEKDSNTKDYEAFDVLTPDVISFALKNGLGGIVLDLKWKSDGRKERMIGTRFLKKLAEIFEGKTFEDVKTGIVIVDEAHTFFPKGTEENSSFAILLSHTLNKLARLGRSRGISLIFSTHRPNDVSQVVQTLTNTKIYFRVDRKLAEELEIEKHYRDRLPYFEDYAAVVSSYTYRGGFMSFVSAPAVVGHRTS